MQSDKDQEDGKAGLNHGGPKGDEPRTGNVPFANADSQGLKGDHYREDKKKDPALQIKMTQPDYLLW